MSEYPKISSKQNGPHDHWARIDFSSREFVHFIKYAESAPEFYAVGRGTNDQVSVQGLSNNDIRRFAEEILRQFPETAPKPEPEYLVLVDDCNDEWVQLAGRTGEFALKLSYSTRAEVSVRFAEAYSLERITGEYGVKAVHIVTGEEPLDV